MPDSKASPRTKPFAPWRSDTLRKFRAPTTLRDAVDGLITALTAHKFVFLFLADPKSQREQFDKQKVFGWEEFESRTYSGEIDIPDYLLSNPFPLQLLEQKVSAKFGPPDAPIGTDDDAPYWTACETTCRHLEESANSILLACEVISRSTTDYGITSVLPQCIDVMHDNGRSRWYCNWRVSWNFLGRLNETILMLKRTLALGGNYLDKEIPKSANPNDGESEDSKSNSECQTPFQVFDVEQKKMVLFNPRSCMKFGPVNEDTDWSGFDGYYQSSIEYVLYRHLKGGWTMVSTKHHCEIGLIGDPEARRVGDPEAAQWLVLNGFRVPDSLSSLASAHVFEPGPPSSAQLPSSSLSKPVWENVTGKLSFNNATIRTVVSKAKNVRKLLAAFHESQWDEVVDSPFPADEAGKQTLRETVREANKRLTEIEFYANGNGEAAGWRRLPAPEPEPEFPF